ncbi:hypothetical protein CYD62_28070 [Klebsiella pneumoniae]|nr:hypothetical protein CYD62_28070 [Klebsiella pneumoniae]
MAGSFSPAVDKTWRLRILPQFMSRSQSILRRLSEKISLSVHFYRESANKQVISSQADSLIKISRIWADFFPANTSNQPI